MGITWSGIILCCFKQKSGDVYEDMPYESMFDIPCRKLMDKPSKTDPMPLKEHVSAGKKAYLIVNLAST
jgi:hypothetical protein